MDIKDVGYPSEPYLTLRELENHLSVSWPILKPSAKLSTLSESLRSIFQRRIHSEMDFWQKWSWKESRYEASCAQGPILGVLDAKSVALS